MSDSDVFWLFVVGIVVFFVVREFWCWFYKTNQILHDLEEMKNKLSTDHTYQIVQDLQEIKGKLGLTDDEDGDDGLTV